MRSALIGLVLLGCGDVATQLEQDAAPEAQAVVVVVTEPEASIPDAACECDDGDPCTLEACHDGVCTHLATIQTGMGCG